MTTKYETLSDPVDNIVENDQNTLKNPLSESESSNNPQENPSETPVKHSDPLENTDSSTKTESIAENNSALILKEQFAKVKSSDNFLNNNEPGTNKNSDTPKKTPTNARNSFTFYPLKPQKKSDNTKNFTHTEIFHQACLERKKTSFNSLKNWDLKRARFLTLHRNILETIQERLIEYVKISQSFMHTFIKYFKDRALQELAYSNQNIQTLDCSDDPSNINQKTYHNFLQNLNNSAQLHQNHCQKVENLGNLIEKSILNETLLLEKSLYDKMVEKYNDNLIRIKKNLTKLNIEASEKSAKYSTLYFTMINAPFGKKTEKDLYRREISFLRTANEQVKFQRKLALETFLFWQNLIEFEINRVNISKNSIETYLKEFHQTYSFLENQENTFINENMGISLDLNEILKHEEIDVIINQAKEFQIDFEDALTFDKLKEFFEGFVIKPNGDEVLLIMKEMKAIRDMGGLISNYVHCKLILTVDGFFLCIDHPYEENEYKKPSMIVNLENTTSIKIKEECFIEITRTKPGFLMNTLEKFLFKFSSKEEVEELFEYINRYYSK